jgi:protein gp37
MSTGSGIEWTDATWNPVTGCTKVSAGCAHCYAERMAKRLEGMGQANYRNGFNLTLHEHMLDIPLGWRQSKRIFVNSMSDLFHDDVPLTFIRRVFAVMRRADWHQYQILTKRADRLARIGPMLSWPDHVWMGVSVETSRYVDRIDRLRACGARTKFLSLEPLLGPLPDLDLQGINWVIVGGESGPGARPMKREWVRDIRSQCRRARVPFFFKQWGGVFKRKAGRLLDGKTWDEMPDDSVPRQRRISLRVVVAS